MFSWPAPHLLPGLLLTSVAKMPNDHTAFQRFDDEDDVKASAADMSNTSNLGDGASTPDLEQGSSTDYMAMEEFEHSMNSFHVILKPVSLTMVLAVSGMRPWWPA